MGCWKQVRGSGAETNFVEISKAEAPLDTKHYYSTLWATSRLDWSLWKAQGIPGIGSLDLEQFWGVQPAHILVYDLGGPKGQRRVFFHMKLASLPWHELWQGKPEMILSPQHPSVSGG